MRPFAENFDTAPLRRYPALATLARSIGNTPLREMPGPPGGARIFAKCEWENATGTIKDRIAFALVHRLLAGLGDERCAGIIEYTGGSLGLSLSRICQRLDIPLTLVLSSSAPPALRAALEAAGTRLELVDNDRGFWAVMERARELARLSPQMHFLFQHENPANPLAHYQTTGSEILSQWECLDLPGEIDAWVASIGTGGTLIGVYRRLVEAFPRIALYATSPAELPYGSRLPPNGLAKFAGSGGLGSSRRQAIVAPEEHRLTGHFTYSYAECLEGMRRFRCATGMLIGSSSAANWMAACRVAEKLGPGRNVITVFPSLASLAEREKLAKENCPEEKS
jgi:cysteine synthase A